MSVLIVGIINKELDIRVVDQDGNGMKTVQYSQLIGTFISKTTQVLFRGMRTSSSSRRIGMRVAHEPASPFGDIRYIVLPPIQPD